VSRTSSTLRQAHRSPIARLIVLSMLTVATAVVPTWACRADRLVMLRNADASPRLKDVAQQLLGNDYEGPNVDCVAAHGQVADDGCPPGERRATVENNVAKGEGDLNDDGIPELFFVDEVFGYCGTRGCRFTVVQKQGHGWRTLLEGSAGPLSSKGIEGDYIRILDKTDFGYHRICSGFIYFWDGTTYQEVFPTKKDKEEDHPVECH
jgi:hypothetical protein